jgi:replication factor A1
MRTWNKPNSQGNLFSCTLKDESGSVRATAFKEDADRLYKDLQVGKTYIITRGSIKPTNKRYDNTGHEYEITFGRDTTVQEVQSGGFAIEYAFKKIAELEKCEPNTTIDIIGVATEIGEVVEITSRKDGRLLKKRDVTVLDDSNASVGITLWGGTAESFEGEAPGALQ